MARAAARRLVSLAILAVCAAGCTGNRPTPAPTPLQVGATPTAGELVSEYASTLAHERFQFDSKTSNAEYVGTLDFANDAADFSLTGTDQLEIRIIGSHQWAKNAFTPNSPQANTLLNPSGAPTNGFGGPGAPPSSPFGGVADSQAWLIDTVPKVDIKTQLPPIIPTPAMLRGLDQGGTSPVRIVGALDVQGAPTTGYQWNVTLTTAETHQFRAASGTAVQVQMRIDAEGRVCELQLTPIIGAAPSEATPSGRAATSTAFGEFDSVLTLNGFTSTPAITAPTNTVTIQQLNADQ
jgi:hypothetical protein